MSTFERWSLMVATVAILVNLVAFGALAWQLRLLATQVTLAKRANDEDHDRRRRQTTLEAHAHVLARQAELRQSIPAEYDRTAVSELVQQAIGGDTAAREAISAYLNLFEWLGNGTRFDVFDLDVIDRGFGRRITMMVDLYSPWIEQRREISGNPDVFGDLHWLAAECRARRGPNSEWLGAGKIRAVASSQR